MGIRQWTTLRLMLAMVGIAVVLWLSRLAWGLFVQTRYVPVYDEGRFHKLRQEMSGAEVEVIAGPPAFKAAWGPDTENWQYSERTVKGAWYHRRWVIMTKGRVSAVVSDIF